MDKVDVKILKELLKDHVMPPSNSQVRRSFRSIAMDVKLDQHAIRSRIIKLQESGVIRGWHIAVNPALFGLRAAGLLLVHGSDRNKDDIAAKISSAVPTLAFVCNHLGEKLTIVFYYKDEEELKNNIELIKKLVNPVQLISLEGPSFACKVIPSETDWLIINSLQQDPWKPFTAIAKELKLSSKTVKRRISKMSEGGAIYLLVNVDIKSFEGIIPVDLTVVYKSLELKEDERMRIIDYLEKEELLVFVEPKGRDIDYFALAVSSMPKAQEIQNWVGRRNGVRESRLGVLLDIKPNYKIYQQFIEKTIEKQRRSVYPKVV